MKETDFYQKHVRKMAGVLHLERIESAVGTGFPDVSAAGGGKQFLIETKVAKVGEGTEWLYFERFQLPFYMKRLRYTNNKGVFVLAMCSSGVCLWRASDLIDSPREPYRKWTRIDLQLAAKPFSVVKGPFTKDRMLHLAEIMIGLS
jgi:hypothetical protein